MDKDFYKLIESLIAQNYRRGQGQIAMERLCSVLLAQFALFSPAPADTFDRMNSELCGIAMGVGASLKDLGVGLDCDSKVITAQIETLISLSENVLASKRVALAIPAWA